MRLTMITRTGVAVLVTDLTPQMLEPETERLTQ
jgi:hypothetical protein